MKATALIANSMLIVMASIATQSAQALTREEVKAELAELRALGYRPEAEDPYYPRHVQEAMARLHQKRMAEQAGHTQANERPVALQRAIGSGRAAVPTVDQVEKRCVGPASFCNPYFGS